jgi:hypothetical protein
MVASSKVPTRIFTSWLKMKKDDKKDTSRNAAEHLMPALPGEAGQMVLGEVGVTLHAKVNAKGEYVWQTKPGGDVGGAGIKGQLEVVDKVPMFIPQDFQALAATIQPHTRKKINPMQLHPWEKSNFQKGTKLSVSGLAAAFKLKKKT